MPEKSILITVTDPNSAAAEAYRALRINLTFAGLDKPIESLMVACITSEEANPGVAANLAVALARAEQRVVLVEADMRRPSLHEVFKAPNERGLTTMIVDPDALEAPPLAEVGIENLWVLPSGPLPPNPADILGSRKMGQVIAALKSQADILVFSAPPVIAVPDAAMLGTKMDGALLVVNSGKTRRDYIQRAKDILEKAQVRIVGAVLNNAPHGTLLGKY